MMTLWFLLTPLLVLPMLLLFRFVGCGLDARGTLEPIELPPRKPPPDGTTPGPGPTQPPADNKPPNYRGYILGEPTTGTVKHPGIVPNGADVMAYWRLIDPAGSTVAKDEKGLYDGTYVSGTALPNVNPTAAIGGSEAAPGDIDEGKTGLILSDPAALGRSFRGGFVRADFKAGLYTDEFTLEAWILAPAQRPNYEHMLFDTGGRYALPGSTARDRGFRVFEDRSGHWQVRVAIGATDVYASPPLVPRPGASHFALVMQNSGAAGAKQLTIYVGGKLTVTATLPSYARPDEAPLFMAVENTTTTLTGTPVFRHPFMSQIQEVVLHKKALSAEEIENHVDINR
jgi:Concanavalin A-like lectin/glucanases superfamily